MRTILLVLSFYFLNNVAAQPVASSSLTPHQVQSLSVLGKVWGFLKYYHPQVTTGKLNWDSVLISKTPLFVQSRDVAATSVLVQSWLTELGKVDTCITCDNQLPDSVCYNLDLSWFYNSGFDAALIHRLEYLQRNRSQQQYYASYGNASQVNCGSELPYAKPEYLYPEPAFRLLSLFRYWNIVQYFSPYKYLCGQDWKNVLNEFIPRVYNAKDTLEYHLCLFELTAKLNDGHSVTSYSPQLLQYFGSYSRVPFQCTLIDGKAVVERIYNDSICAVQHIQKGDVFISVNGESIADKKKRWLKYVMAASNDGAREAVFCSTLLFQSADSICKAEKLVDGKRVPVVLKVYTTYPENPVVAKPWKLLQQDIAYVDLGQLQVKDVPGMMNELKQVGSIIFDIRNYPRDTWPALANYLAARPFTFSRMTFPDLKYPGVFRWMKAAVYGRQSDTAYKGKVILLVDVSTKSHGEYTAMALQAATKTITIGSTTAGADGNITPWTTFPGRFMTHFSGLGIYYPDGTPAQRKGIKIDIVVHPTIAGLQAGRDEVLEKAVEIVRRQ
ncbi:MAG: S41 family peptidase [Chitinophagaceae bacterium]